MTNLTSPPGCVPPGPWPWTDDTEMPAPFVDELHHSGTIDQDRLAAAFAERFEPYRGYGGGAVVILRQIRNGVAWQEISRSAFGGQGSMGNGAATRVAPLGAYHCGDSRTAALEAMRSAEVTHAHAEAVLGRGVHRAGRHPRRVAGQPGAAAGLHCPAGERVGGDGPPGDGRPDG